MTEDIFEGSAPIKGLEHLGRHIRDAQGAPSGSPANFENTRGVLDPSMRALTAGEIAAMEDALVKSFADISAP